ncbi:MAG TPA: hypothetical protein VJ776_02975 [Thermoanaerobaculia bacterium]|nr:hypothetical protein [Thermoanaerobaculia bacterium]
MSAESSFQGDYIRRTERFKALSTFDQFLRGVHRAFQQIPGGYVVGLAPLYAEIRRLSGARKADAAPAREETLTDLDAKLYAAAEQLRSADMSLSPSLTRRYFEKVRPSDERIPFYILRFYFSLLETDEDLIDKVDYLATVLAAGSPDPGASPVRSRNDIRELFERLLAESAWPSIDAEAVPEIVRAFDETSAQIAAARGFEELTGEGRLESLRNLKRQVSRGLANPEILTAAASCNLAARTAFRRLYEKEERGLREVTRRIDEMEGRSAPGEIGDMVKLNRFRESRRELDRQVAEGTVRWRQLVEVQQAAADALRMLAGAEAARSEGVADLGDGEAVLEGEDDRFWGPCLRRILTAVAAGDTVKSVEGWRALTECKLEIWEAEAARRVISRMTLTKPDRVVLFAAALRVKAESETETIRRSVGAEISAELLRDARATLRHASELDKTFAGFAAASSGEEAAKDVRRWTRTRLRLLHATSALWLGLDR